jgi:hypothetical protein
MRLKLSYYNTTSIVLPHVQGRHDKDLVVLHETVSADAPGFTDILNVERYLATKDYGIHGMTDAEGNIAWALGCGGAIFWQAGGVNERSMGIEQVSRVMLQSPSNIIRQHIWAARQKQLRATARLLSAIHYAWRIPLVYSDGLHPGITSHWDVSHHYAASEGHTDCWPVHKGGYYPILAVINFAKGLEKLGGYKF